MGQSKRRQFTPEFKAQAVKLVVDGGHSIRQIAADLGVCESLLRRWRREGEEVASPAPTRTVRRRAAQGFGGDSSRLGAAVVHQPGGRPNQPVEDDQTHHVRPGRFPTPAAPRSSRHVRPAVITQSAGDPNFIRPLHRPAVGVRA